MKNLITGRQPVLEALKSDQSLEKIVLVYGARGAGIDRIRQQAKRRGVPVTEMDRARFEQLAGTSSQGVAAFGSEKEYVDIDALLDIARQRNEPPFLLVLDEIEDPHNLGALIRTAECAGMHGVILPKHHSASINETVAKTSAGASVHLPAAKVGNIAQTLEELKRQGVWIIGADSGGDRSYAEADYRDPVAIVIGNEGRGLRRLVKEKCDFLVRIPLFGKIDSLNASVAGGLVMFEAARRRQENPRER